MKGKVAFLMAVMIAATLVFVDGMAVYALEETEAVTETSESAEPVKTEMSEGTEDVAEEAPGAEEEEILFEDSDPMQISETFADVEETEMERVPETEVPDDAEAEQTIELDLDENEWIEIAPTVAAEEAEGNVALTEENFPDTNFLKYIKLRFNAYGAEYLTPEQIADVTDIIVSGSNITDLKGIEYFSNLEYLSCGLNQLTSLDLSKNPALTRLDCHDNQLTSLNVSGNAALYRLECNGNQLENVDLSRNPALTMLACNDNQLTSLDVSSSTELEWLECNDNQLTSLDLSKNPALTHLVCEDNQLMSLNVSSSTALKSLSCNGNQLTSLDVSHNKALTELDCGKNQLTELNVNSNPALTCLDCYVNQLTGLNLNSNTALTRLDCRGNQLTELNVNSNAALTRLDCYNNQLTELSINNNPVLTWLDCAKNQLTKLDVSGATALMVLSCADNHLTRLDLSQNSNLTDFDGGWNSVTVQLPYTDDGWKLDMAEIVGSENLSKLEDGFSYPDGYADPQGDGLVFFPKDKLSKYIEWGYFCREDCVLALRIFLEKGPVQTEKETQPGGTTDQPGTNPGQSVENADQPGGTAAQVKLNVSSIKLKTKQSTSKVKISGLAPGDAVVSWKSSNPKIVTVNKKTGKITAKSKKGTATITVTLKSGDSKTIEVSVQKKEVACTKINLNKKSVTLKKGKKFTLKPIVTPITCVQKVKYKSSKNSVATVSKKGVIKAKKKGTATITVTVGKKQVKCKVKVK